MRIFLLDDEAHSHRSGFLDVLPNDQLVVATNRDEGVKKYPLLNPYDLLLLDHDMEGYYERRPDHPNTGLSFVNWLVEHHPRTEENNPLCIVHSWNPEGAHEMLRVLRASKFRILRIEFGQTLLNSLEQECRRWTPEASSSLRVQSSLSATPSKSVEASRDRG